MSDIKLNLSKTTAMLDLSKAAPSLKKVKGVLSWGMHPLHKNSTSEGFDLDIFAFITENSKISGGSDVVFFNNKTAYDGAVNYPHDNRTGGDDGKDDSEEVFVEFSKLPSSKTSVELFVFIFESDKRKQDFSMMANSKFDLVDADTGSIIQSYKLNQFVNGSAVHIGSLVKTKDSWGFQPVGESAQADANQVLSAFI